MSERVRCFIAIELSQEIRETLGKIENEWQKTIHGVKWVKPDNIHLTLKFLGHIEKETVEEIKKIMDEIAAGIKPFKIRLSSAGAFPSPTRPRVIWIGIDEGKNETSNIANLIENKVAALGIGKEDRVFHAHLTLARVNFLKDKDSVKNAFASLKIPQTEMTATEITLFQSTLIREGPIYNILHEVNWGSRLY